MEHADDAIELSDINGTWVAADCEPVSIEFAWQRHDFQKTVTEADCICSHELAARLIHSLFTGAQEDRVEMDAPGESRAAFASIALPI
jgi:hypothetical protein